MSCHTHQPSTAEIRPQDLCADPLRLDACEWRYKSEGLGNLVIGYVGPHRDTHTASDGNGNNTPPPLPPAAPVCDRRGSGRDGGGDGRLVGRVLRLSKTAALDIYHQKQQQEGGEEDADPAHTLTPAITNNNNSNNSQDEQQQLFVYRFMRRVMGPLMGPQWIDCGVRVPVQRGFLRQVAQMVHRERPLHRQEGQEQVDVDARHALLMTDHTQIARAVHSTTRQPQEMHQKMGQQQEDLANPVFCVEIKPKWGTMCRSNLAHEKHHRQIKRKVCRYCMHQRYKLSCGDIDRISSYCPMDIYSEDPERVAWALQGLCDDPQNNMKLFVNGKLMWWGDGKRGERAPRQVDYRAQLTALLEQYQLPQLCTKSGHGNRQCQGQKDNKTSRAEEEEDRSDVVSNFTQIVQQCLDRSGILRHIRRVQMLDTMDVDMVSHVYDSMLQRGFSIDELHDLMYDMSDSDRSGSNGSSSANSISDHNEDGILLWVQRLQREIWQTPQRIHFRCRSRQIFNAGAEQESIYEDEDDSDDNILRRTTVDEDGVSWFDKFDDAIDSDFDEGDEDEDGDIQRSSLKKEKAYLERCLNDDDEAIHALRSFLIAQAAKDCSIMITIHTRKVPSDDAPTTETHDPHDQEEQVAGQLALDVKDKTEGITSILQYRVVVVDLDPKVVHRLPHYHEFDSKIVEHFKKVCKTHRVEK